MSIEWTYCRLADRPCTSRQLVMMMGGGHRAEVVVRRDLDRLLRRGDIRVAGYARNPKRRSERDPRWLAVYEVVA